MITKLTPKRELALLKFRDEWVGWGICTDRANRERAEGVIRAMRQRIKAENHTPILSGAKLPRDIIDGD